MHKAYFYSGIDHGPTHCNTGVYHSVYAYNARELTIGRYVGQSLVGPTVFRGPAEFRAGPRHLGFYEPSRGINRGIRLARGILLFRGLRRF